MTWFPGEKSPGLIEARRYSTHSDGRSPFPGEKSPGLIEARPGGYCVWKNVTPFPGEKSPGLIEAWSKNPMSAA